MVLKKIQLSNFYLISSVFNIGLALFCFKALLEISSGLYFKIINILKCAGLSVIKIEKYKDAIKLNLFIPVVLVKMIQRDDDVVDPRQESGCDIKINITISQA